MYSLDVVVQEELVRMGPEPEGVHFLGPFVVDMHLDGVLGEDVALQQEVVVRFEVVQCLFERARLANSSVINMLLPRIKMTIFLARAYFVGTAYFKMWHYSIH